MHRRSFPQMARYLAAALLALLALARPAVADTALLRVSPQTLQVGDTETLVEVTLDGVSGLYGLDIRLEFDPALLEVLDADEGKDGVQPSPGTFPSPDFVVRNEADNASGTLWYAVTQLNPREPATGSGVVCSFLVRGLAAGSGQIRVVEAKLVDRSGADLAAEASGAEVTVSLEAPASEVPATATPTATPQPTATATSTSTPAPTEEPTATPEPDEPEPTATQEPTATDEPADPDPTATNAPTATPEPTATATPSLTSAPAQPARGEESAYPAPSPTVGAPPTATPSPSRPPTGAAPRPSETPEPTATATEGPTASPQPAVLAAAPAAPAPEEAAPPAAHAPEMEPLLSPRLFAALLGLVAAAALALAVRLTRHDAQPPDPTAERRSL